MSFFRIFYIVLVTLLTMRSPRDFVLQRLRRNDETLRNVTITERWEAIEILDALKQSTVVKYVMLQLPPLTEEMFEKLSEVMDYNKTVDDLAVFLGDSNTAPVNLSLNGLALETIWQQCRVMDILMSCKGACKMFEYP